MDISVLLNWIFGGTSVVAIVLFLIFFKQNRKLKNNEVSQSDTKTQSEQINLGMQFIENSQKAVEMIQKTTSGIDEKIDNLNDKFERKMTASTRNQASMNKKLKLIEKYLNGGFKEFVEAEKMKK